MFFGDRAQRFNFVQQFANEPRRQRSAVPRHDRSDRNVRASSATTYNGCC
jgi:hypothetical protein